MNPSRSFASDNSSGIHPEVLRAIEAVNVGHVPAYGNDPFTRQCRDLFRHHLGDGADPYLVFGGTGANVLGLRAITESYHAIVCAESSHIHVDECGAPERHLGTKLLAVATTDGKLRPEDVRPHLKGFGVEHHAQPRVISLTQATELGTVYRVEEIRAVATLAHQHGLLVHMDGARLGNAAVALGRSLREITVDAGVDVLSFGGTKAGLMGAEAVVFLREAHAERFRFLRKQGMQLPSKMRFLAAQFTALLSEDLWRRNAEHANRLAALLAERVGAVDGVEITQPVESNAVFARMPAGAIGPLRERWFFYVWDEARAEVRWMTSWDTEEEDVEMFAAALAEEVARATA